MKMVFDIFDYQADILFIIMYFTSILPGHLSNE